MKRKSVEDPANHETIRRKRPMRWTSPCPEVDLTKKITSYDSLNLLNLVIPAEIKRPKSHMLKLVSEDYRLHGKKMIPYTNSDGVTFPLDCWMEIVPAVNRFMKTCVKGKMIKTFYSDDTHEPISIPSGLHIFDVPRDITQGLIQDAPRDAKDIYWSPRHRMDKRIHIQKLTASPACNLLFYAGCSMAQPKIREIFEILFTEAPALAKYTMMYLSVIRDILKLTNDELDAINLTLVHYDPMGGINPHVDTVYLFNGTLGPIFTVAMGDHEKLLDLVPVLLPSTEKPVRVFSKPNELMLMDGIARTLYAHGKPLEYPHEQFTLVFKCPEYRTKTHTTEFKYEGKTLSIPFHYQSPFKVHDGELD